MSLVVLDIECMENKIVKKLGVCGDFLTQMNIPIQVWHMVEVMRRDFNVSMTENHLGEMQIMQIIEEVAEHMGMNYTEAPDSRYVAQPIDDWEEGSLDNPNTIELDEGFSEPITRVSEPTRQPPVMEARPALRSIENLQNSLAARLVDSSLICKQFCCCLVFCNFFLCI